MLKLLLLRNSLHCLYPGSDYHADTEIPAIMHLFPPKPALKWQIPADIHPYEAQNA